MRDLSLRDLPPLEDGEPVWGVMPSKMSDKDMKDLQDEAYATPKGMLTGLFLGLLMWGLVFFVIWMLMW